MSVLIGGGRGFIGRNLRKFLTENGYECTIVSRQKGEGCITWGDLRKHGLPKNCEAVINLAGENIMDVRHRWSDDFKGIMWSSRVATTKQLINQICEAEQKPKVFIGISGISCYKPSETKEYTEESDCEEYDFLSSLVRAWEAESLSLSDVGVRRVIVRSGIVLGSDGGMIKNIYLPFFLGLGGRLGSGKQWLSWVHLRDTIGLIRHAIEDGRVEGVFNGTAPNPCSNSEFTAAYARSLWRPACLPVPGFALSFVLGSERAKVVLEGQKVLPKRTLQSGYKFLYPTIADACAAL